MDDFYVGGFIVRDVHTGRPFRLAFILILAYTCSEHVSPFLCRILALRYEECGEAEANEGKTSKPKRAHTHTHTKEKLCQINVS